MISVYYVLMDFTPCEGERAADCSVFGSRFFGLPALSFIGVICKLEEVPLLFLNHFSPPDCNLYIGKENNFAKGKKKPRVSERGMEKKTQKKGNL